MSARSHLEGELRLVRDQVDLLQIEVSKRDKPWYRQIPIMISAVALLFSVFTGIYTISRESAEAVRSKKEELRKVAIDLARVPYEESDPGGLKSVKAAVYLAAAERLMVDIPEEVSAVEYQIVGREHEDIGNVSRAADYYQMASESCKTPYECVVAFRNLGFIYFQPSHIQDLVSAREYFLESVALHEKEPDLSILTLATTYDRWGLNELEFGSEEEGLRLIELAREGYAKLPRGEDLIEDLKDRVWRVSDRESQEE